MRRLQALRYLARAKLDRPVDLAEYAKLIQACPAPSHATSQLPSLAELDIARASSSANQRQIRAASCCKTGGRYELLIGGRPMKNSPSDVARMMHPVPMPMLGDHPIKGTKKDVPRDYSILNALPESSMLADPPTHHYEPGEHEVFAGTSLDVETHCEHRAQGDFKIVSSVKASPVLKKAVRPSVAID